MKAKIKFDKQAIQDFLLQHGEKFVVGIAVLVFLTLCYKGLSGRESYLRKPDDLSRGAQAARNNWEGTNPDDVIITDPDGPTVPIGSQDKVAEGPYVWRQPPIPATKPPQVGQPGILPLVDLRGVSGIGAVNVKGGPQPTGAAPAGGGRRGLRWVVLTAKVQYSAQTVLMNDHYRGGPFTVPSTETLYYAYLVQRAEVTDQAIPSDQLKWVRLRVDTMARTTAGCGCLAADVVDAKYLLPSGDPRKRLVAPLPQLITAQVAGPTGTGPGISPWARDESAASLPQIPLKWSQGPKPDPAAPKDADVPDEPDAPFDPFNEGLRAQPAEPAIATPEPAVAEPVDDTQFLLFRFLDYTVEPGKRYRYRAQLALKNPNFGQEARYLINPDLASRAYLLSPFSDPTEEISVSRDTRVLAGSVDSPSAAQYGVKPKSKVMLVTFDMAQGRKVYGEIETSRGSMANLPAGGAEAQVAFITNAMVLDMGGGQKLSGKAKLESPGNLLLLHADGRMEVRYEIEDLPNYGQRTEPPRPAQTPGFGHGEPAGPATPFH